MPSGLFVTLEGCEGSGKTSQVRYLRANLKGLGIPVTVVREPGGTTLGDKLRRILKFSSIPLTPETELLLFNASRAELVKQIVVPALRDGHVVICDRFTGSTIAYQGYGRGLSLDLVRSVNAAATGGLKPDITILLDISPEEGLMRNTSPRDRFETDFEKPEVIGFHRKIRQGYLDLAAQNPQGWVVVDATLSQEDVANRIWNELLPSLENEGYIRQAT